MNFIILASTLLIGLIAFFFISKDNQKKKTVEQNFWDKEHRANFVRKKSLDGLNYITIPESLLSLQTKNPSDRTLSYLQDLRDLSSLPIVNLTGISNTDLKLTYGTANITVLSEYDAHYTQMVTILQKLAESLIADGEKEPATAVLEFAVSTGSDVSKSYYLLAELYQENNTPEKIDALIRHAQGLSSMMKGSILRNLQASGQ